MSLRRAILNGRDSPRVSYAYGYDVALRRQTEKKRERDKKREPCSIHFAPRGSKGRNFFPPTFRTRVFLCLSLFTPPLPPVTSPLTHLRSSPLIARSLCLSLYVAFPPALTLSLSFSLCFSTLFLGPFSSSTYPLLHRSPIGCSPTR